jgi:glycosyltransferase involved in cell wall biosynthesis
VKVFINPHPREYQEDGKGSGGIWRVINAQARWLPEYGVEIADDEESADVVLIHAGSLVRTSKPIVAQSHGAYWTGDFEWPDHFWQYNGSVIEALRRGHKIITPSEWVAQPIRRDMRKNPIVIPHGVEFDEFGPQKDNAGYILWAKPRTDVVSDPKPLNELAQRMPDVDFISTFGRPSSNVRITGAMPYAQFQEVMEHAGIWLATTRETGDIASREAMARGIPVVGFNWGATGELVRHMENGYLAEPGDYESLAYGVRYCLEHRAQIGEQAREWIRANYQWKALMARYADAIRTAYEGDQYEVDITVMVPAYNYAHFLPEALESIGAQTFQGSIQVVVVDDCSTDNTQEVLAQGHYPAVEIVRHEYNQGLPAALNTGLAHAKGEYVIPLDADNLFTPAALQTLYDALEEKPWLDVASGHLFVYSEDGNHKRNDWPFGSVDIEGQFHHYNQLPSSSLMRRRSIQRLGGWRRRQHKNEDGEFWCRAMSAGLYFEQVTSDPVLIYRWHGNNKSKTEGGEDDPDGVLAWNFHYPWKDDQRIVPFACTMPPPRGSWPVRSYESPHISVCIACGPGHDVFLQDALDSVAGQSFPLIECVVANDTGQPLDVEAMGHPWVRVVDTTGRTGPAVARNTAIAAAKAPLIAVLDADDMFYPHWLRTAYEAYLEFPQCIIYADCDTEQKVGERDRYNSGVFSVERIMGTGRRDTNHYPQAVYQSAILYPKQWWHAVGGYPTDQPHGMYEDWLFGVKMHLLGIGAAYCQGVAWGVYRHWTDSEITGSKNAIDNADHGSPEFRRKFDEICDWIDKKEQEMACTGCRKKAKGTTVVQGRRVPIPTGPDRVFRCISPRTGTYAVNSRIQPGKKYRVKAGDVFTVPAGDAELVFSGLTKEFEEVLPEPEQAGAVIPAQPISPPEIVVPEPQPAPVTAEAPEELVPERVDDLDRLGLHFLITDVLRENHFTRVQDIAFDIRAGDGQGLKALKGIATKRYEKIVEAVEALEAA